MKHFLILMLCFGVNYLTAQEKAINEDYLIKDKNARIKKIKSDDIYYRDFLNKDFNKYDSYRIKSKMIIGGEVVMPSWSPSTFGIVNYPIYRLEFILTISNSDSLDLWMVGHKNDYPLEEIVFVDTMACEIFHLNDTCNLDDRVAVSYNKSLIQPSIYLFLSSGETLILEVLDYSPIEKNSKNIEPRMLSYQVLRKLIIRKQKKR